MLAGCINARGDDAEFGRTCVGGTLQHRIATGLRTASTNGKNPVSVPYEFFTCRLGCKEAACRKPAGAPSSLRPACKVVEHKFCRAGCARPRVAVRETSGATCARTANVIDRRTIAGAVSDIKDPASLRSAPNSNFSSVGKICGKGRAEKSCSEITKSFQTFEWRSLRESNPCFSLERAKTGRPSAIEDIIASFPKVPPGPRLRRRRRTHRGSALRKCVRVNVHWGEERQRIPTAG